MEAKVKINQITDWEQHGYRLEKELGKNSVGGRVTGAIMPDGSNYNP